jgi:hypothetical protein
MVNAFFSETRVVKYTLSDPKDAGFIQWCIMKIIGKSLFMTCVHTAMSSKSAERIRRIYMFSSRNSPKKSDNIKGAPCTPQEISLLRAEFESHRALLLARPLNRKGVSNVFACDGASWT